MDNVSMKEILNEIKGDVKDVKKTIIKQGEDIAQLKVWAWISRSTTVAFFGALVSWVKSKVA